jgi:hypothetical protein
VTALARALRLPVERLLELQRDADGGGERSGPGKPIGEWDAYDLEVHPAGPGNMVVDRSVTPGARVLPAYVRRTHDQVLAEAVRDVVAGLSRILVLVGSSSTGKTRACWEAVQPLAGGCGIPSIRPGPMLRWRTCHVLGHARWCG